jgi:putative transposase
MLKYLLLVIKTLFSARQGQRQLALENLALRQQLALLHQTVKRPRITPLDRYFWVIFSKQVAEWRPMLHVIQPDTVVKWHRQSFKLFWAWKSRRRMVGRPRVDHEIRALIHQMQSDNVGWGRLGFTGNC